MFHALVLKTIHPLDINVRIGLNCLIPRPSPPRRSARGRCDTILILSCLWRDWAHEPRCHQHQHQDLSVLAAIVANLS